MPFYLQVIYEVSEGKRVKEDNVDVLEMVNFAKEGRLKKALQVAKKKPYLVNAIPEQHAWSVLHYAVYYDDISAIEELLKVPNCDIEIKAKADHGNVGAAGMMPIDLAKKYNKSCLKILRKNHEKEEVYEEVTFIELKTDTDSIISDETLYGYIYLAVAFLPQNKLEKIELEQCSFAKMCGIVYDLLQGDHEFVQNAVVACMRPFDRIIADEIKGSKTLHQFQKAMIKVFTFNGHFYKCVNGALRRAAFVVQEHFGGKTNARSPKGNDMTLSMYTLFLQAILLYWEELPKVTVTTYRSVRLPVEHAKRYQPNTAICWLPFSSSSSREKDVAEKLLCSSDDGIPIMFKINNQKESIWSPRDIAQFSWLKTEEEVLHPCGTKFVIRDRKEMPEYIMFEIELVKHIECEQHLPQPMP